MDKNNSRQDEQQIEEQLEAMAKAGTFEQIQKKSKPYLCNIALYSVRLYLHHTVTPTTGYCFCFGPVSSFFLELFLFSSPVAY